MSTPEIILEKMEQMFGDRVADPNQHPKQFFYQVSLAKYELALEQAQNAKNEDSTDQNPDIG
jgi:hypothetical protein